MASLQQKNIEVRIYIIPSEFQLSEYKKTKITEYPLCLKAQEKGIDCINLIQKLINHYSNKENNALFLDGYHRTVEGNQKVASWLRNK